MAAEWIYITPRREREGGGEQGRANQIRRQLFQPMNLPLYPGLPSAWNWKSAKLCFKKGKILDFAVETYRLKG